MRQKNDGFGVVGNADVLELLDEERGAWLGATTETNLETNVLSRTRKMRKRSRSKSLSG
jgi:hypothetical protein